MNELAAAEAFLCATLKAHPGVAELVGSRVYLYQAPEGATFPFILVALNAASDRNAVGADVRLFTRATFLVKGITKERGGMAEASALATAIDAALMGASGTVTVEETLYAIRGCYRTEPVRLVMGAGDQRYNHAGGLYRLHAMDL